MEKSLKIIKFTAKITPIKVGFFVSIWKRNQLGITVPQDILDEWDFMQIDCQDGLNNGYFKFPKQILVQKNIVSSLVNRGINGMRVYPSWVKPINPSSIKAQQWQLQYFYLK
jgi:hypothetical protein